MNIQRFREVLQYIEAHPQEFYQLAWRGTRCCLAGNTVRMFEPKEYERYAYQKALPNSDIKFPATRLLGLTTEERLWLFAPNRTLEDFRTVARRSFA